MVYIRFLVARADFPLEAEAIALCVVTVFCAVVWDIEAPVALGPPVCPLVWLLEPYVGCYVVVSPEARPYLFGDSQCWSTCPPGVLG